MWSLEIYLAQTLQKALRPSIRWSMSHMSMWGASELPIQAKTSKLPDPETLKSIEIQKISGLTSASLVNLFEMHFRF